VETALHRQLKSRYGPEVGGREEVTLSGFRIDAVDPDGSLVEVQSGSLGPLRGKLSRLLVEHRVRVVKPVIATKRVVRRARRDGKDLSCRLSPKRGGAIDAFDDLVGLIRLFPHPNLRIDVVEVAIDEVRVPRRRWPGFAIVDRRLRDVGETIALKAPEDLYRLIAAPLPDRFTTVDLANATDRPMAFAQRVAYCLRMGDAATAVGKVGNRIVYERRG
jgi:hypothetical protein